MAKILQIVATNPDHKNFEKSLNDKSDWHAVVNALDCIRTACGVQLEGDDGYTGSETKDGKVTCHLCRQTIEIFQSIKKWR